MKNKNGLIFELKNVKILLLKKDVKRVNNMKETIFLIIGLILSVIGVILIYDARDITKKLFSFGDQNEASAGLKIVGFIMSIIGFLIIYFNINI